ncbi:MgtC/SapB family protein [Rhodocytophaga aerolata]|uniref:MgtC/SapB family protein n=1 Tax=Rhodocytophaga aerolata TaxID=455078 RepID=A0ABT8RGZ5_9BACT|nr:MgtC/SapB family protein [Rhodocytophaga aerolata]MDO1450428.1 MgtC/SapB family protein [Rhodocytophaga aerolata]
MNVELIKIFGISLGLGLLVGLQREHANSAIAGIRTFPIITLFGTISGLLAQQFGGFVLAGALLAVAGLVIAVNIYHPSDDPGQTTEAAILLMFVVGAYLPFGNQPIAIACGAITAVLLHFKNPLHTLVSRFGYADIRVIMQFVLISLVILPILPDRTYGPYQVLNPRDIWLMVVLIVGIGIAGYFAYKFWGSKAGIILGGILGGLISSTATTVSYAKHSKEAPKLVKPAAFVITAASAIAFIRILVEIAVVAPRYLLTFALPLGVVLLVMIILSVITYTGNHHGQEKSMLEQKNPAQLKSALVFGLIYGLVVLGTAAAKDYFGRNGLYTVAIISGLTDVDAITLSTARLVNTQSLEPHAGWKIVLIASLSNLAFKAGIVATLGNRKLLLTMAMLFGITIGCGLLVLFLWPENLLTNLINQTDK